LLFFVVGLAVGIGRASIKGYGLGMVAGAGPCREAAVEIQSSVPWIGFPVGYAVSGILLTVFGHFAMILAQ
jgi:putative transport protein